MSESVPHGGELVNRINLNTPIDYTRNYVELGNLELSDLTSTVTEILAFSTVAEPKPVIDCSILGILQ